MIHVPTPAAESTRALNDRVGSALGITIKTASVPKLVLRALGLFDPLMRELVEMTYQWEVPYVIDDGKFTRTFAIQATPVEQAVAQVAQWARVLYANAA